MDRALTDLPVWVVWLTGGVVAVLALAVVALAWSALRTARTLRRTTAAQAAAVAEIERLRTELTADPVAPEPEASPATPSPTTPSRAEYLITSVLTDAERSALALPARADAADGAADLPTRVVDARQFTSMAVGESLVRLFTVGHGVRRALSAESRNRAGFAMRREVRRSRKHRRQELREARRFLHAEQRARLDADPSRRPGDDAA